MGVTEYFSSIIVFMMGFFTEGITKDLTTAYIYNENVTWNKAFEKCQMVGLDNKVNVSVGSTTEVWVGASAYYTPWAEYKGCFIFNDISVLEIHQINPTYPFLSCSERCKDYTHFGLQNSQCGCLKANTISNLFLKSLCSSKPCQEDINALCSDDKNGFVIYKKVTMMSFTNQIGNCMTVSKSYWNNQNKQYYSPRSCSQVLPFLCQQAYNVEKGVTASRSDIWINGYTKCVTPAIPASVSVIERSVIPSRQFWIGVIRRFKEVYPAALQPKYCMAAHVTVDGYVVRSVRDCNDSLPVLCERVPSDMRMDDEDGSLLNTEGFVVLVLSVVLAIVTVIAVALFVRLKIKARNTDNQSSAEPERPDIVYAQVNKPPKNSRQNDTTHMNNEQTSYDVYDHMDHTCRPHDLPENNYDTMQSIEATENSEDVYDFANASDEWNIIIDNNEEYSHIEINDVT